jgi:hypothetical protein
MLGDRRRRHTPPSVENTSEREIHTYALFDATDAGRVNELQAELHSLGVRLSPLDDGVVVEHQRPLLVFLSDALLVNVGTAQARVSAWEGQVIPVTLAELTVNVPEVIKDRSSLDARDGVPGSVAQSISLSLRVSPAWMLAWLELESSAERYTSPIDTPRHGWLLSPAELERALATVAARPRRYLPALPDDVERLLDASAQAVRRRFAIRLTAVVGATLLLAIVALVALVQRHSALQAAAHARLAAARSEADRLSRIALADLPTDPDLPVLLARRAYRLAPGPETRETLRRALDAVPWHRSYRLAAPPSSVAGSPSSPLVLVTLGDGSVSLIDVRTGRTIASAQRPRSHEGDAAAAISIGGGRVALAYNGGLVQVRTMNAAFRVVWSERLPGLGAAESLSIAWLPGNRDLLTAWSGRSAVEVDLPSRSGRRVDIAGMSSVGAVAVSSDGALAAVADSRHVAILRTTTLRPCAVMTEPPEPDGSSLLFDDPRDTLVLMQLRNAPIQIPVPTRCRTPGGTTPEEAGWPGASGNMAAAVLGDGTVAFGTLFGKVVMQVPPATYTTGEFVADEGGVVGVASADGMLVTAGTDGWLRVWDVGKPAPVYPIYPAQQIALNETPGSPAATWRPMIAVNNAGTRVSTGGPSTGYLWVGDARDLTRTDERAFITLDTSIRPVLAGECAALVITSSGAVAELRCHKRHVVVTWRRSAGLKRATLLNSAISADGGLVALAEPNEVELTNTAKDTTTTIPAQELVTVAFDQARELIGAEADGALLDIDPSGSARTIPVDLGAETVRAAGIEPSGEAALLVGADGQLAYVNTANGAVLKRLTVPAGLSSIIDVRISSDGKLALLIARDGYWVIDLAHWRVIASSEGYDESDLGAQPRDGVFLGSSDTLLILRADEGIQTLHLEPWRFLDGRALLNATAPALPRAFTPADAEQASAIPSEGE